LIRELIAASTLYEAYIPFVDLPDLLLCALKSQKGHRRGTLPTKNFFPRNADPFRRLRPDLLPGCSCYNLIRLWKLLKTI
ncbi:MAG: hypothetical protein LUF04_07515, partial [Bacteroides sp.]|nr:hypothetical protein [Bacteroides sp.]